MDMKFVNQFMARKADIENIFREKHPDTYGEIVQAVISVLSDEDDFCTPDPERIHTIDDGHYQGTLVFVIAEKGYQPSEYWYVRVGYGSCSGCDTLEHIRGFRDETPTDEQVKDYMTLALHIVQGLKKMGDEIE